jgi:hypothetical protein
MATMNSENDFQQMDIRKKQVAYGFFAAALLLAIIPVWMGIQYRTEYLPVCLWGGALALIALGAGITQLLLPPTDLSPADSKRLLILMVGGLSGIATVVFLGLGLTAKWWDQVTGGWETWHGKEAWHVWACLLSVVGGLAIMFVSLNLAQGDKESSSAYRRLLYGYNTVLTGCLLLLILVIANVLVYIPWGPLAFFNNTYYWSTSSIYALSSQSERILQGLDKPLKIYAIVSENDGIYYPVRALLDNCRSAQPDIQVKYLSPDLDKEEVARLGKQYKFSGERAGLLVIYGTEPKAQSRFIKRDDLISADASQMMARSSQGMFKGESALISEVNTLVEGKDKPVVYFTQGNGELDIADREIAQRPGTDTGCGIYRDKLDAGNFKVLGLQFSPVKGVKAKSPDIVVSTEVPDDAATVVIAGPTKRFEKEAVEALRRYLEPSEPGKKKGTLIVMLDPVITGENRSETTGLEELLAGYNVEVGKNRVLELRNRYSRDLDVVLAGVNPDRGLRSQNPVLDAFAGQGFLFLKSRTVQGQPASPAGRERYRSDMLLATQPGDYAIAETNMEPDPRRLLKELDNRGELAKRISPEPLSLAVAVSEVTGPPPNPMNPHAPPPTDSKPRLIVFGSSSPLRNSLSSMNYFEGFYDFFASNINWLRGRSSNIGIEAKKRDIYLVKSDTNFSRMIWLPALLMFVGVVGLGTGVWVVRRR